MKDKLTKTVRRLIRTADFESIEITNTVEREVEYSTSSEKVFAESQLRQEVAETLKQDIDYIMGILGISEKRVFVKANKPVPSAIANTEL